MRRIALVVACLVAGGAYLSLRAPDTSEAGDTYAVDAIFDTAKGVLPGQIVKVAGAQVGTIEDVSLTPQYKARISMSVDARFAPFRTDARCEIQPEAIVSENFVQCDPGTPSAPELTSEDGFAPTVSLDQTTAPVNLTDLFEIWQTPVRERIPLVVATLGIGIAGRGEDVNELLRRANPTLQLARQAIGMLNAQRRELGEITTAADHVVGELARRAPRIQDFIDAGARVTGRLAERRGDLAQAVRLLPPLLDQAEPALQRLDELSAAAGPILTNLESSGPGLDSLLTNTIATARAGEPALDALSKATDQAIDTVDAAKPLAGLVRQFAHEALPAGALLADLFVSLRERGFVEGLLNFVYAFAAETARYDSIAHLAPLLLAGNECSFPGAKRTINCNSGWAPPDQPPHPKDEKPPTGAGGTAAAEPAAPIPPQTPTGPAEPPAEEPAPAPAPSAPGEEQPKPGGGPLLPNLPILPDVGEPPADQNGNQRPNAIDDLLDFLFG